MSFEDQTGLPVVVFGNSALGDAAARALVDEIENLTGEVYISGNH